MKKAIIILLLCFVCFKNFAQIFELPSFQNNHVSNYIWSKDTLLENQSYENGPYRMEHSTDSNRIYLKRYLRDRLLSILEVQKKFIIDKEVSSINEFGETYKLDSFTGTISVPKGRYREFIEYNGQLFETNIGQFKNGLKVGKWYSQEAPRKNIKHIYYDSLGNFTGEYVEYYPDTLGKPDSTLIIYCKGKYEQKKDRTNKDSRFSWRRYGLWHYYYKDGTLRTTVVYKHKK